MREGGREEVEEQEQAHEHEQEQDDDDDELSRPRTSPVHCGASLYTLHIALWHRHQARLQSIT